VNWLGWAGLGVTFVIALGGWIFASVGQRAQARAQVRTAQLTADGTAGQLALQFATKATERLDVAEHKVAQLERWEDDVEWWYDHDDRPWHNAVTRTLADCECHRVHSIPSPVPMPRRRYDAPNS
jgi:hypothetical protein